MERNKQTNKLKKAEKIFKKLSYKDKNKIILYLENLAKGSCNQ